MVLKGTKARQEGVYGRSAGGYFKHLNANQFQRKMNAVGECGE